MPFRFNPCSDCCGESCTCEACTECPMASEIDVTFASFANNNCTGCSVLNDTWTIQHAHASTSVCTDVGSGRWVAVWEADFDVSSDGVQYYSGSCEDVAYIRITVEFGVNQTANTRQVYVTIDAYDSGDNLLGTMAVFDDTETGISDAWNCSSSPRSVPLSGSVHDECQGAVTCVITVA